MSLGYIAAGLLLVANTSLVGYAATRVARRQSDSTIALLFYSLLFGIAEIVGMCMLLGVVGLLAWPEILIVEFVVAGYARYRFHEFRSISRLVLWWPGIVAGAVILGISCVIALSSPSMDADTNTYHLLNAAAWLHSGNIWALTFAVPNSGNAIAPGNADILTTWLMLPSHSDQIACLTPIIYGSLLVLATAQLASSLGASVRRGVAVGLAIVVTPAVTLTQSHSALVDLASSAGIVSGLALALRARFENRSLWWLSAGACFGFSAGSKVVALLPSIFALIITMTLIPNKRWRALTLLIAGYIPLGLVWYLRNWVQAGNPLFPDTIRIGPLNLRGAPLVGDTSVMSHIVMGHWSIVGNVIGIAAELVGPALALLLVAIAHARHPKAITGRLGFLSALLVVAYLVTPYAGGGPTGHTTDIATDMRYLFPALFVAGTVTAATLKPRTFGIFIAVIALFGTVIFVTRATAFRGDLTVTTLGIAVAAVIVLATCGSIAIATKMSRSGHKAGLRTAAAAIGVACCGTCLLYSRVPPQASDGAVQALGDRVAAIGVVPDLRALLGADLSTTVLSVGYGPQGAQTAIADQHSFDMALKELNVGVIAVGLTSDSVPEGWTAAANWARVGEQGGAIIYRLRK